MMCLNSHITHSIIFNVSKFDVLKLLRRQMFQLILNRVLVVRPRIYAIVKITIHNTFYPIP